MSLSRPFQGLCAAGATLFAPAASLSQAPSAPWITFPTAHYRIHAPAGGPLEAFAREVARRVEGIHGLMEPWIGHAHAGPTDILVLDPMAAANGQTVSLLKRPCITLWTTPPDSDEEIAHGRDWIEELVPHEMVHLHHLTWPDRRPGILDALPGLPRPSAVARKAPAWVCEGYATLLEGRLTGLGRPHGAHRAWILRQEAREGRLPSYGNLDRGSGRYLVSSAFLAWLEQHGPAGERSFPQLWQRLSSRRYPTFPLAFQATFGQSPETAYGRFCAELAHDALETERSLAQAGLREGQLWTFVPNRVASLSVSPDGRHLLGRVASATAGGLCLWDLDPAKAKPSAHPRKAREEDALPPETARLRPEQAPARRLGTRESQLPERPRWTPEGIAYRLRRPDAEGVLHPVERIWRPEGISFALGTLEILQPRWEGPRWVLSAGGRTLPLPFEPMGPLVWDRTRHRAFGVRAVQGIPALVQVAFDPGASQPIGEERVLTRTASAALSPAPTPDGKALYFAVPTLGGTEIRRLELEEAQAPLAPWQAPGDPFAPGTVNPAPDAPSLIPTPGPAPAAHPYRVAETHALRMRLGALYGPAGRTSLLGLGGSDILPRLDWQVLGAFSPLDPGPAGLAAGGTWRGSAWNPQATFFQERLRPSRQDPHPVTGWDRERRGVELGLSRAWLNLGDGLRLQVALGSETQEALGSETQVALASETQEALASETQEALGSETQEAQHASPRLEGRRSVLWTRGRQGFTWECDGWSGSTSGAFQAALGRSEGRRWNLQRFQAGFEAAYRNLGIKGEAEGGRLGGAPTAADAFHLGGQDDGILPASLEANAVFQPALPGRTAQGDRFLRWRAEGPFGLYLEGASLWYAGSGRPSALRVAGLEARLDSRELQPYLSDMIRRLLGASEMRLGVHRPLDGPSRHRTVFTLAFLARY